MATSNRRIKCACHTASRGKFNVPINKVMHAFDMTTQTEPAISFGTSTRPPLLNTEDNPGPGAYQIRTLLQGKVPDSRIRTIPQYSMRGREKFGSNNLKAIDPTAINEPGPGHYQQTIVNPNENNAPNFTFPKGRFPRDKKKMQPGPGDYKLKGAIGPQVLSTKYSNNPMVFGRGNRPALLQASTSALVGPGEYQSSYPACEEQIDSRKATNHGTHFGKASRDCYKPSLLDVPSPGPGGYDVAFKGRKGFSMSGRERFGSPW